MTRPRRRRPPAAAPSRPRASRARQRQRLIDACISALHVHGPSKTTVEKVVAIARMSPGIVRFYFDSKDAMLVASLEFLAAEFEERLLVPIAALRSRPVEALATLVDLYLGVELASTRKVSVWYAFWGEASARQEYHDICGSRDDKFEELVRDLIARLIEETGARHLDADAIALGLIGVLEMLWQGFAFQTESTIDRGEAKRRALAYLRSVFPGAFGLAPGAAPAALPAGAYASAPLLEAERRALFRHAWQFAGLGRELGAAGAFLMLDGPGERALVVRDAAGALNALRNSCHQRPHALAMSRSGTFGGLICCPLHGLSYHLDGTPAGATPGAALARLELALAGELVFVRAPADDAAPPPAPDAAPGAAAVPLAAPVVREHEVAADWKVLVERWLERAAGGAEPRGSGPEGAAADAAGGWSARRYAALGAQAGAAPPRASFVAPNQLIEAGAGGVVVLQVLPVAPGRARLREFVYGRESRTRIDRALAFLAARLEARRLAAEVGLAESVQRGLESPGYVAEAVADAPPALVAFRQSIARLLPGGARDPGDPP
ncbi:MAG TPA: TetR family transcriptional regulator C-terminal domain-containing protein [Steroidobacteraceae bacterium]|nr:TetR family transcriptional regulator C-terminal domain-containing protein [Steroidobacteraceae bacterium]